MIRFFNILTIIFIWGCYSKDKIVTAKSTSLLKEIHNVIDSIVNNLSRPYNDYMYTVTHQKKDCRNYIKISTAEYFNRDSVSAYEIYKDRLLIFYSKEFFKNLLVKTDTLGLINYKLAYENETISLYHPHYEIIEILENGKFRIVPMNEHHDKKLFYFDDRYIPEPVPNDSLLNKK